MINPAVTELQVIFNLTAAQARSTVKALQNSDDIDDEVYEIMFEHYCNMGEMPYGTATAKDGDPIEWVTEKVKEELGIE